MLVLTNNILRSNCLSIQSPTHLPHQLIHPSIHPSVHPSIHLSIQPTIYLSAHLSIHPSTTSTHPPSHLLTDPCMPLSTHSSYTPVISSGYSWSFNTIGSNTFNGDGNEYSNTCTHNEHVILWLISTHRWHVLTLTIMNFCMGWYHCMRMMLRVVAAQRYCWSLNGLRAVWGMES